MEPGKPSGLPQPEDDGESLQSPAWDVHAAHRARTAHLNQINTQQWPPGTVDQLPFMTWDGFNIVEPQDVEQYLLSPAHAAFDNGTYLGQPVARHAAYTGLPAVPLLNADHGHIETSEQYSKSTQPSQVAPGLSAQTASAKKSESRSKPVGSSSHAPAKRGKPKKSGSQESSTGEQTSNGTSTTPATGTPTIPEAQKDEDHATPSSSTREMTTDANLQEDGSSSTLLERNRVAASKFRNRKRDETKELMADEKSLEQLHEQLSKCHSQLKSEMLHLKSLLLQHATCDCVMIREYITRESQRILREAGREGNGASNEWPVDITDRQMMDSLSDLG